MRRDTQGGVCDEGVRGQVEEEGRTGVEPESMADRGHCSPGPRSVVEKVFIFRSVGKVVDVACWILVSETCPSRLRGITMPLGVILSILFDPLDVFGAHQCIIQDSDNDKRSTSDRTIGVVSAAKDVR